MSSSGHANNLLLLHAAHTDADLFARHATSAPDLACPEGTDDESSPEWTEGMRSAEPSSLVQVACVVIERLAHAVASGRTEIRLWQGAAVVALACSLMTDAGFVAVTAFDEVIATPA